ncbi:DUF1801 domain-containing protein [Phenylobacterium zucineum]|uniref:DUF1801 domain-containing protein n=1 Tax=Phenylobacterium zucineum TaxID=284016 RepID=UPI0006741D81|nr:DUF1801 domain-containing protein [Phenylobacterium zucineum]
MVQSKAPTVDAYLAEASPERAGDLARLRDLARRLLPDHEETMTWGRPTFVRAGRPAFGFAEQRQYLSLYFADPGVLQTPAAARTGGGRGKGCLRFRKSAVIDWAALEQLLRTARERAQPAGAAAAATNRLTKAPSAS